MPKFRFHRGSLEESLKTEVEVRSMKNLHEIISSKLSEYHISESSLITEYYGYDNRLVKDLYSVRVFGVGVIGFLDEQLT